MKIEVKNVSGKGVGSIDLDDAVFGADVNEHILWEAVKWQLAKRRAGNASTKRYGEVRGSGDFRKVLNGMLGGIWVTAILAIASGLAVVAPVRE